jgi:hypothetical protein
MRSKRNAFAKIGVRLHSAGQGSMKHVWFFLAVIAITLAGCSSPEKDFTQEVSRVTPADPPAFLNPDVAGLFGQANFSARVEVQKGMQGTRAPMLGQLFGRDGSLFFIADQQQGKAAVASGLSALWDGKTQTAYLLNEPLQGYAPIRNPATNGPAEIVAAGEENLGTEPCRKFTLNRRVANDTVPILIVWRGTAHQDFPLKIQTTNSPGAATLTLTKVQFQAPPAVMFALPNGFKRYESTDAMTAELINRRTDLLSGRAAKKRDRFGNPAFDDEQGAPTAPPPRY